MVARCTQDKRFIFKQVQRVSGARTAPTQVTDLQGPSLGIVQYCNSIVFNSTSQYGSMLILPEHQSLLSKAHALSLLILTTFP